jgi:hypothetical protein
VALGAIVAAFHPGAIAPRIAAGAQPSLNPARINGVVVDASGAPLEGATVTLWTLGWYGKKHPEGATTTAGDGTFRFDRLFHAHYNIGVQKPGYTAELRADNSIVDIPRAAHADLTGDRLVAEVRVTMHPAGRISGRLTRPDGTPAVGATVAAGTLDRHGNFDAVKPGVTTGAEGRYAIDELPVGSYVVVARDSVRRELEAAGKAVPPDYVEYVLTAHPGTHLKAATPVHVRAAGDATGTDFALRLEGTHTIVGAIVTDSGWRPKAVWLEWGAIDGEAFGHDDRAGSVDGTFAVRGVRGRVGLLARAWTGNRLLNAVAVVDASSGSVRDVRLRLGTPARVRGRLVVEDGLVLPQDAHVSVALDPDWPRVPCLSDTLHGSDPEPYDVYVDSQARFEFSDVIGERTFRVIGLPPALAVKEIRHRGRVVSGGRLNLRPTDNIKDVEIAIGKAGL